MAKNMFEEALAGIGAAIGDVREKYEEAVFGRGVTDSGIATPSEDTGMAGFGSLTTNVQAGAGLNDAPASMVESSVAPPEGLSGEILPPDSPSGPKDTGDALRLEGPVIDVASGGNAFEQALGSKLSETAIPDKSQDMPEPGGGMDI